MEAHKSGIASTALHAPVGRVHAKNPFVRFDKQWTWTCIPDCFTRSRNANPGRIALGLIHWDLTYADLDHLSNQVAHALSSLCPAGPEPVALLLEQEAPVPAVMLGVLKTGKFYVPLDPSYPVERNRYVLQDTGAEVLITNDRNISFAAALCGKDCRILNLDEISSRYSGEFSTVASAADDLVQVLYTSGSTGKPKGVMHTHHSLLSNVMRHTNGRHTCKDDRVGVLFSYSFGPSIVNTFTAILNGAAAFPFNIRELGVGRLASWLIDREITQVHTVPTLFRHFVAGLHVGQTFPKLRLIELGGETMFSKDLERFKEHFNGACRLSIGMGTAETGHIFDCGYDQNTECGTEILPAGYVTEGTQMILLDERRQPIKSGGVGEIAIKGDFLSPGYWNQPELTAKAFLPDPAGGYERIYLTGDLGCMLTDGCVFHLGRKDARVKIRGYRIEIPEIEAALLNVPGVKEAAVVVDDSVADERRLVAYLSSDAEKPTGRSLRSSLRQRLPGYMIPSRFFFLESLPLLPNGKVDRQALPQHAPQVAAGENGGSVPRYQLEAQLCAIWEELLRLPQVGIQDDFFDLGGDSLLAVEMVSRIQEVCGGELSLSDFAPEITIERLVQALTEQHRREAPSLVRAMQTNGSKKPLFFHNGDTWTGGLYCRNLARQLGPDQPFYSLMPHGFHKDPVPETIEAMAADHVRSILAIQPRGPFQVGGFCYGGAIALEICRQLQAQGHEVETLLMVDTQARNLSYRIVRDAVTCLCALLRLASGQERAIFLRIKNFCVVFQQVSKGGTWSTVPFLSGKLKTYVVRGLRVIVRLPIQRPEDSARQLSDEWDESTPFRRAHEAMEVYVPKKFSGRIVLLRSARLNERAPDDPTAGWKHITPNVSVEWLRGDHLSCATKHVADLAEKMRPYLSADQHSRDHDLDGFALAHATAEPKGHGA
jgi:amino acid adenylation domain-containing protein